MKKVIQRILGYAGAYRYLAVLTIVFAISGGVLSLLVPVYIGKAVDVMLGVGAVDRDTLLYLIALLAGIILASALLQWGMALCTNRLASYTIRDIRIALFKQLNRVPLRFIDGQKRGNLIQSAVNDIEQISDGLIQGATQLLSGIVTIVGTLLFMLTINMKITLLVVLLTPLSLLVASQIAKRCHSAFEKQQNYRGLFAGFAEEQVGHQKLTLAFGYEARAEASFEQINEKLCSSGIRATFLSAMTNPCTRFVNGVIYAAVGTVGAFSAIGAVGILGQITVGQLTSFLAYANQYTKPFNEISGVFAELQNAVTAAQRVFAVIDAEPETSDTALPQLTDCDGSITLSHVSFSYQPERKLLTDVTLDIQPGQQIAIVGPTGCGKTTLINLLLRFYEPQGGTICLSGQDITHVTRQSLRSAYGMVLQDTWLFTGTIAENICYGKPDATREEMISAAKEAHAHSFIQRLPQGYDTVLTEEVALSQGQKQLLSIARIMLTDPPILILDEATSSIDIRTEQRVRRAFDRLMVGKTSIMIAHRLATIRNADCILVMRDGDIVEHGTHEALCRQHGFYASLYESQFAQTSEQ